MQDEGLLDKGTRLLLDKGTRLARLLKEARLWLAACVEDIDDHKPWGLDQPTLLKLAGGQWIRDHQNVIITGPTGVGKTFIACANEPMRPAARVSPPVTPGCPACYLTWSWPRPTALIPG